MTQDATCRCSETAELWDDEAWRYARNHLREVQVRADGWETVYQCTTTGREWVMDHPQSELHGGGPARLRHLT